MEIERKFTVKTLPPDLEQYPCREIRQAYLSTDPVVRVRQDGEDCWLTYKGKGFLFREEANLPLTPSACRSLMAKAGGLLIVKTRWCIPWEGHTIELDVFQPPLAPLVLAEVEFPTEEEALAFQPPEWFGREVTYDPSCCNASLSRGPEPQIRPGRYRHFKGGEYEVLYVASHSETLEPMVVYRAMYGERGFWVRPASMWNELVTRDGKTFPRFTYLGDA